MVGYPHKRHSTIVPKRASYLDNWYYCKVQSDLASLVRGLEIPGESQANIQTGKNIVRSHDRVVIKTWDPAATFHDGVKPCTALMDFIIQTCTVE
ncbi:hypothetical protein STEG23_014294 [Scotinomys teguina]